VSAECHDRNAPDLSVQFRRDQESGTKYLALLIIRFASAYQRAASLLDIAVDPNCKGSGVPRECTNSILRGVPPRMLEPLSASCPSCRRARTRRSRIYCPPTAVCRARGRLSTVRPAQRRRETHSRYGCVRFEATKAGPP
jgi:hypothetical protein